MRCAALVAILMAGCLQPSVGVPPGVDNPSTGCDPDFPHVRAWENPEWNVVADEALTIAPTCHALYLGIPDDRHVLALTALRNGTQQTILPELFRLWGSDEHAIAYSSLTDRRACPTLHVTAETETYSFPRHCGLVLDIAFPVLLALWSPPEGPSVILEWNVVSNTTRTLMEDPRARDTEIVDGTYAGASVYVAFSQGSEMRVLHHDLRTNTTDLVHVAQSRLEGGNLAGLPSGAVFWLQTEHAEGTVFSYAPGARAVDLGVPARYLVASDRMVLIVGQPWHASTTCPHSTVAAVDVAGRMRMLVDAADCMMVNGAGVLGHNVFLSASLGQEYSVIHREV
jgi:hypothetical protein